jgi:hypothetical protein
MVFWIPEILESVTRKSYEVFTLKVLSVILYE